MFNPSNNSNILKFQDDKYAFVCLPRLTARRFCALRFALFHYSSLFSVNDCTLRMNKDNNNNNMTRQR